MGLMTVSNADLATVAAMARYPDKVIARRLGVSDRTVLRYRRRLGIPAWRETRNPTWMHGASAYAAGLCRCDECTEANRVRHELGRADRKAKGLPDDDPRHGTVNGYSNWSCRCDECRAAWSVKMAQRKRGVS
jgi:hypothetical protein